jgi:uncharacterized protein (DUF4415 family)
MAKKKLMKTYEPGRGFTKKDWDAVDFPEMTAEELARMRPAREVLDPKLLATLTKKFRGPQKAPKKVQIAIRLDPIVLERYRATGRGWQVRMNDDLLKMSKKLKAA